MSNTSFWGGWVVPVVAMVGLCAAPAFGWSYTEWDASSGNWWTASNWNNGVPNLPDDIAGYLINGGTVQITHGDPNAAGFTVSVGHVEHTGGILTSSVALGNQDDASPTYRLAGTGQIDGGVYVGFGDRIVATFTQDGGVIDGMVSVGDQGDCLGQFHLNDGEINAGLVVVGKYAQGEFYHDGGTVDLSPTGQLTVGDYAPSVGTYEMIGPGTELLASIYRIGREGRGTFIQYDGASDVEVIHLGERTDSFGRLELRGGTTDVSMRIHVGEWGEGELEVTGGSHVVTGPVYVGERSGSRGTCWFDGGTFQSWSLYVGSEGEGQATQSAGTVDVELLLLGHYSNSYGTYELDGGLLRADYVTVGFGGEGRFTQTGGEHTVAWDLTVDGDWETPSLYELDGPATLDATDEYIGYYGEGRFLHGDGDHTVTGGISIGGEDGSQGTYELMGPGMLEAGTICVGEWGFGELIQSGGSIDVAGELVLAAERFAFEDFAFGGEGRFELSGGLFQAEGELIGLAGPAVAIHTGGCNVVRGTLTLGAGADANGTYELSGTGELEADALVVGQAGTGSLTQTDGYLTAREVVVGADATGQGTLRIENGYFDTDELCIGPWGNGTLDLADGLAELHVRQVLCLGPGATVTADANATIFVSGYLVTIEGDDPDALPGLARTRLVFEDTDEDCELEVAGFPGLGFDDNFALAALQVGAEEGSAGVVLIDDVDNGNRYEGDAECLFVGELLIEAGSVLDLAGHWLYLDGNQMEAVGFYLEEGMIVDCTQPSLTAWYEPNMDWTVIPEPATAALVLAGLALAAARRRRRP